MQRSDIEGAGRDFAQRISTLAPFSGLVFVRVSPGADPAADSVGQRCIWAVVPETTERGNETGKSQGAV